MIRLWICQMWREFIQKRFTPIMLTSSTLSDRRLVIFLLFKFYYLLSRLLHLGDFYSQFRYRWACNPRKISNDITNKLWWHRREGECWVYCGIWAEIGELYGTLGWSQIGAISCLSSVCKVSVYCQLNWSLWIHFSTYFRSLHSIPLVIFTFSFDGKYENKKVFFVIDIQKSRLKAQKHLLRQKK